MKITLSLSEKQNQHTEKNEILMRCSMGRTCRYRVKSGIYIHPEFWNKKDGTFKSTNRIQTNKVIELNRSKVQIEQLCRIIEEESTKTPIEDITREWLENVITSFHNPKIEIDKKGLSLFDVLEKFVINGKENCNWKKRTAQHFHTLKNHLSDYSEDNNIELNFNTLDKNFFDDFAKYLLNSKNLINSTNAKTIKNLKWFLRWAMNEGYHENSFFLHYTPTICKPKSDKRFVVFLNNEELQMLKNYDFSNNEQLNKTKDFFLFCCYSGLRYSDVKNLQQKDIYDDIIHVTTIKVDDSVNINLNDVTRSILKKYKTDNPLDNAIPLLSNQKMNVNLKQMAKIAGINQLITNTYYKGNQRIDETKPKYEWLSTHSGRKTFICTLLSKGVAPQMVMKFTGHNSYDSMKPYIDVTEQAKADAMALLNE